MCHHNHWETRHNIFVNLTVQSHNLEQKKRKKNLICKFGMLFKDCIFKDVTQIIINILNSLGFQHSNDHLELHQYNYRQ